jgi:regulation of enolase protein 1 (concanavalin A-like superfamily)
MKRILSALVYGWLAVGMLEGSNVALRGVASQINTNRISADPHAGKAIDGNRDNNLNNGSVACTVITTNFTDQWWIVDFRTNRYVDIAAVWNTGLGNNTLLNYLQVDLLNNASNVVTGGSIPEVTVANGVACIPLNAIGRYLRIYRTFDNEFVSGTNTVHSNMLAFAEVEAWGHTNTNYVNLARHYSAVSQSSVYMDANFNSYDANLAVDGNISGIFTNLSVSHTDPAVTSGTWWEAAFYDTSYASSPVQISEFTLFNRSDTAGRRLSNFRVSIYTNNAEAFGQNFFTNLDSVAQGGYFHYAFPYPVEGERLRISLLNNTNNNSTTDRILSLAEVQIMGRPSRDNVRPTLVSAANVSNDTVMIQFSEPVQLLTATNKTNYTVFGPAGAMVVSKATLSSLGDTVFLTVSNLAYGARYTNIVNNVRDRALTPNTIVANSSNQFVVVSNLLVNVGGSTLGIAVTNVANGLDLTAGGTNWGGLVDQAGFGYELRVGDFDVRVRVESIAGPNPLARGGLMVRAATNNNAAFAAVWATPGMAGCFFQARTNDDTVFFTQGNVPANFPNTWLRLQRVGSNVTGYASYDGLNWALAGSAAIAMRDPVLLGFAACSQEPTARATVNFRDYASVTGTPVGNYQPPPWEPLGPSSRRCGLVISEIMYNPKEATNYNNSTEFIEIFNAQPYKEDLGGYRISGSVDYTFPSNTVIKPNSFLVLARNPTYLSSLYNITNVIGPWDGATTNDLPAKGGTVRLRNRTDAVLLEIAYGDDTPWPVAADGTGHSLVLTRPSYGENNPQAWGISERIGGSPGRMEYYYSEPLRNVVINEFLAHTDLPQVDYLELYNHSTQAVDLSGAWLSDDWATNKFRIPDGTWIGATGYVYFTDTVMGFALSAAGERIFLVNSNQDRVMDAVSFQGQANGVSVGRYPNGSAAFYPLASVTPGAANTGIKLPEVVINELMFSPITGNSDDEYVELYNRTASPINLSGWRLEDGVSYTFPVNTIIPQYGYLVVARNLTNLLAKYPGTLNELNTVGNYSGTLGNGGERIALQMPDTIISTNTNTLVLTTNLIHIVYNEVTYRDGGRWGVWSDGGGSSLELKDANSDNRLAANWADSDETAKSSNLWTTIEFAGTMGEVISWSGTTNIPSSTNQSLHVYLLGMGEALVDSLEVHSGIGGGEGPNLLSYNNYVIGTNTNNWMVLGAFDQTTAESPGFSNPNCLHIRAAARGDMGANKIRSPIFPVMVESPVTIRGKARWLRGWPEILLRLHGGGAEASARLQVPTNLGTPGAPNSRSVNNAGPAIHTVQHFPVLPAAGQSVVVTAQAHDPNGLTSLQLMYRIEPASNFTAVVMRDDGSGGDTVAGDGVYSATLPAQSQGALAAFFVLATDTFGATNTFPQDLFPQPGLVRCFPSDSPARECVIRFGEVQPHGAFGTYRVWMTTSTSNRWHTRDTLSNAELDATYVYNDYRVVYNAIAFYSGSPFHRGNMTAGPTATSTRCDYMLRMPGDDEVFGEGDFNVALPGNASGFTTRDPSLQAEQTALLLFQEMRVPSLYRKYIHLYVNGNQRNIVGNVPGTILYEDGQQPNGVVLKQYYPDDPDGDLIKLEDWFEFDDRGTTFKNNDADLTRALITVNGTNAINWARYRYQWRQRSLAPGQFASDYSTFQTLLDVVSPTTNNSAPIDFNAVNEVANLEEWMYEIACQRTVGNFDSYGFNRGKNNFMYKPVNGRFELLPWDVDWVMGAEVGGNGATQGLTNNTSDARALQMYNHPTIRRMLLRAYKELVDGPFSNAYLDPVMDEKAAAFDENNIGYSAAMLAYVKEYIGSRRNYILQQMNGLTNAFSLGITNLQVTNNNFITLTGSAPVNVKGIWINGVEYPPVWNTNWVSWTIQVPVGQGTNRLVVQGYDRDGNALTTASNLTTVVYIGPAPAPQDVVVFNEIMANPTVPDAEYVELFNRSTNFTFALANWRVNGLGYTFPPGSVLGPQQYLVLAKNRFAYTNTHGVTAPFFGEYAGNLQANGETLTLLRPSATPGVEEVVDKVRYETVSPWPLRTNLLGVAAQLVDDSRDNSRAGNWAAGGGWKFYAFTGTNQAANPAATLKLFLTNSGTVLLDDVMVVSGVLAGAGNNLVTNGDFESAFGTAWGFLGTGAHTSTNTVQYARTGNQALQVNFTSVGSGANCVVQSNLNLAPNTPYTLSFWAWQLSTNNSLNVALGSDISSAHSLMGVAATPGMSNSMALRLPELPGIWLNEIQPENRTNLLDNYGQFDPWIELYNNGTNSINLTGWYLANNYSNLAQWPFPAGTIINPGQFLLLWADGETNQTAGTNIHANFRLTPGSGSVALALPSSNTLVVLDYINYTNVPAGYSHGSYPEGQAFTRQDFYLATPGNTNSALIGIFINEWLASNTRTLMEPIGLRYEDWFELYNPGNTDVELGGYYLTDNLANKNQFKIPDGYRVPARGYLLVWADNASGNNSTNSPDLHVNFQLSKSGEAIGLFASDGTAIDSITFGAQTNDLSQGRYPDGGSTITNLPVPTPRIANYALPLGNNAPVFGTLSNWSIIVNQIVSFTATANDTDLPSQTLTFSLVPGAPYGATMGTSGNFYWQPVPGQAPTTNRIQLVVTDNGSPSLSSTGSFTIVVGLPPQFNPGLTVISNSVVSFGFNTLPGKNYQVEYKTNLAQILWLSLGNTATASNATLNVSDDMSTNHQRFYRIRQLD